MKKPIALRCFPFMLYTICTLLWLLPAGCSHDTGKENDPFPLLGITVAELQEKMTKGELSAADATAYYLERIRLIDQQGIALHAVIELNPDAIGIATERDIERSRGMIRGPLHGIPILIKDNFETGDRMQTTAGSLAMTGNRAKEDAFVIRQLREQGAVILGKTNMTEWSNFRSIHAISGWSSRGGQTKNPYVLTISPCGSSSGSAVAVAADLCTVAVGTSTNGSIACPSSFSGVVGIRPTLGLVSRTGTIPVSKSQDTPGAIGRTVEDAAILLGAMTGFDSMDNATMRAKGKTIRDYTPYLQKNGLAGKRIGIDKSMLYEQEGMGKLLQQAIREMKQAGATIVEVEFTEQYYALTDAEGKLLKYEFKDGINKYIAACQSEHMSLDDVMQWNRENASVVMKDFQQDLFEEVQALGDLNSAPYLDAKHQIETFRIYLESMMTMHNLDAIAGIGNGAYGPPAVSGWPSITVPSGFINEVPVGLTFFGRPFGEPGLLAIAYAFEKVSKKYKSPAFLPEIKSS